MTTPEWIGLTITLISIGIGLTAFVIKWSIKNNSLSDDFKKNVDESKILFDAHVSESREYQARMSEKINGFTGKVDSIEKMGNELVRGQAQSEIVMEFMREISRETKDTLEKISTSFDRLAIVLDRMNERQREL